MSAARAVAVSMVSAGLALALLSLLLHQLLRALVALAEVVLLPLPLRVFGALQAVAALPLGIDGQAASLRAVAVGVAAWRAEGGCDVLLSRQLLGDVARNLDRLTTTTTDPQLLTRARDALALLEP